jgi:ribosomal protein S21
MKLITVIKEGESIEKALKKYKKKIDKAKVMKELRDRKQYVKPSKIKRDKIIKAYYRELIKAQEQE